MPSSLQATILGSGTSQGVPMIGCGCAVCQSSDPRDQRTRCSLYLQSADFSILVDTTPELRVQTLREKIQNVDAVLVTHAHADHVMGLDDLRRFCEITGKAMPLYASAATFESLRRIFYWAFDEKTPSGYVRVLPHIVDAPFDLGPWRITPLPVLHGETVTHGYLFKSGGQKKLAYISDAKTIPETTLALLENVPVLILDGLRDEIHPTHLTVSEAMALGQSVQAGQTILTHLTHQKTHAQRLTECLPGCTVGFDGMKIPL